MFINHRLKLLFIHIPKTGGSSVARFFGTSVKDTVFNGIDQNNTSGIQEHSHAKELLNKMGAAYHQYTSFTLVRNPYDAVVSHYEYSRQYGGPTDRSFKDYCRLLVKPGVERDLMLEYLSDEKGKMLINDIIKFEGLSDNVNTYLKKAGVQEHFDRHDLKTVRKDYHQYYDEYTFNLITRYMKHDIAYFGYSF